MEEVADGGTAAAGTLLQLGYDGALVGGRQGRCAEDGRQLGVLLDEAAEGSEGAGRGLEGGSLDCGGVLFRWEEE